MYAPVDGARALVNKTALDKAREQPCRLGLVMSGHGAVGIVPLAQDPEPLKVLRLPLQSVGRKLATRATDAQRRHVGFLRAELSIYVQLDRQTMAVITRNVRRVIAHHGARLNDEVFQDLVKRGSEMDVGVCVRRAIVQDELFRARA